MAPLMPKYAAIVEDDPQLAGQLCDILTASGWQCASFGLGQAFLSQQRRRAFDIAVLDMRLPDLSGLDVLKQLAELPTPATAAPTASIVVTGLLDETNLEHAFALGAQDYLLKPFRSRELLARIQAAQRRRGGECPAAPSAFGPFSIDRQARRVFRSGQAIPLTDKEFGTAELLFLRLGHTVGRADLRNAVWQSEPAVASRTIDTHVSRVRCKLGLSESSGLRLSTVYGVGYRLDRVSEQV
jgi:DNA-binding response OmpR family regulator